MTPATSASFYQPAFNDFLYAQVEAGTNDNPLSVLSALARMGVDPWIEAAELAKLPPVAARRRLTEFLERLPNRTWGDLESGPIVDRLLKLLPQSSSSGVPVVQMSNASLQESFTPRLRILVCVAISVYAIAVGVHYRSQLAQPEAPAVSTTHSTISKTSK